MVEWSLLLQSVKEEQEEGISLRYDPLYDQIKEARFEEDPRLSQGIWQRDVKKADWDQVIDLSQLALQKSKDLQIACWFVEAWVIQQELQGFKEGFEFLDAFCQAFWPIMYPQGSDEEERYEYRYPLFEWLDRQLSQRLRQIPITNPSDADIACFSLHDWANAMQLEQATKIKPDSKKILEKAEAKGDVTLSKFTKSLKKTSQDSLKTLLEKAEQALHALSCFSQTLKNLCGDKSPFLKELQETLEEMKRFASQSQQQIPKEPIIALTKEVESEPKIQGTFIMERKEIYQSLEDLANRLLEIEPHSPTPQLLKQIRTWENKSLGEIIASFGVQEFPLLLKLLGVKI